MFAGVPHHITQRGNRREDVFFNEADRAAYLAWLGEYRAKYKVRVLAYCLMTNHIHVVAVPEADSRCNESSDPCIPGMLNASIERSIGRDTCGRGGRVVFLIRVG
ncbi:MAG: transposase [Gammaproteobacteria bacterium]